jgi:hypothetical protein
MSTAQMISFILRRVGSHGSSAARAKRLAAFPVTGLKQMLAFLTTHSTLGGQFAERIGLDDAACVAIRQAYEQVGRQRLPLYRVKTDRMPPA